MSDPIPRSPGHRLLSHTADVIIEAWGPDLATCCRELAAGLAETHLDLDHARTRSVRRLRLPPAPAEELVLVVLDELIFLSDTSPDVPVIDGVQPRPDGGLDLDIRFAERDSVESIGASPKGISRSGLELTAGPDGVHCQVIVDV